MKAERELDKEVTYKRCRECAVLFARMPFELKEGLASDRNFQRTELLYFLSSSSTRKLLRKRTGTVLGKGLCLK